MLLLRMSRECKRVPRYSFESFLIGRLTVNPGPAGLARDCEIRHAARRHSSVDSAAGASLADGGLGLAQDIEQRVHHYPLMGVPRALSRDIVGEERKVFARLAQSSKIWTKTN